MENEKRALKTNTMKQLSLEEMALIKGGKQKPKKPEKPKIPKDLVTQPVVVDDRIEVKIGI